MERRPPVGTAARSAARTAYRHPGKGAGTAWNADLWSAQRPAGPRAAPCRPPFTGRRHRARSAANGVGHSIVRIMPNAGIRAEKGPPRNWGSFPPPRRRRLGALSPGSTSGRRTPAQQGLGDAGRRRVVLHGCAQQEIGIGSDLHSSLAHPAATASFSSSTERRRVSGAANMPKTLEIGSPGFARSRTWPSGSRSTSTLSPCRAPRCSRTSLRRVIRPLAVTVNVMAMARSPYGRKALWPFPTVQIPLLGGTTGPSRPRRIPDRTPATRITPGTPASPPGGGFHIGTAARRRSEIASGSSSGITCKVPCPRPRGCAIAPSLDQPTPVIDRTSSNRRPLSTGPHSQPTPRYRPDLLPADLRYRPDLLQPTPVIDRTPCSRPALSTGPPSADPRYRPDLLQPTPVIDRTPCGRPGVIDRTPCGRPGVIDRTPCSRPALSTGPPAADPRYRPDPLQPTRVIDRTLCSRPALSTGPPPADPRYRPDLLQPTPVIDRTPCSRPALSTGPPPTDARYRPDLLQPTPVIDRTSSSRRPLSTGPRPADPRYRPDLPQPTLDIDRTSPNRRSLSTGPRPADARYRPDLLSFAMSLRQSRHACATARPTASASARRARTTGFPVARRTACSSGPL